MTQGKNSVAEYFERIKRKAPEYLDLLVAETEAEFEAAFTPLLEKAVSNLETDKKKSATLDEDGLSSVLQAWLSIPGLTVTRETNSNGHVDLTIEADHCVPARRKLAEAKVYAGPSYHIKGIGQLLGRYTTGREGRGLLISYVRKKNIKGLTGRLRAAMDAERPEKQIGPCQDHILKWSLITRHKHSSGEVVSVAHVGCNLAL